MLYRIRSGILAIAIGACIWAFTTPAIGAHADNVILMISDGMGFNTVRATDYWLGSTAVYETFPVKYGVSTFSASNPAGYDPIQMWSNPNYGTSGATDSAAAATAIYTGEKTYNGRISWSTSGSALTTIAENADTRSKATGIVSSDKWSDPTPGAVFAHNESRYNFDQIANEMIYDSGLDVVMGAGHPYYDNSGVNYYPTIVDDQYVGGISTWNDLTDIDGANGFSFVESKSGFENLANGLASYDKIVGTAQVNQTLQQQRSGSAMNDNVPTLETMTKAALEVLAADPEGFFLMVEGGAIDWASHENDLTRMIEEQVDFNNSVQAVVDWITLNSSLDETLLIVTSDHETGFLWGPDGVYDHIDDNGAGNLPDAVYYSGSHSNSLVPLYALGAGSDLFAGLTVGTDAGMGSHWGLYDTGFSSGAYIDNVDIFSVMDAAMAPVPVPATIFLLGSGFIGLLGYRRNFKK